MLCVFLSIADNNILQCT